MVGTSEAPTLSSSPSEAPHSRAAPSACPSAASSPANTSRLHLSGMALLVFELTRCRSLPRSTPDVHDPDDVGAFIDGEEHAIRMRTATVVENTNRLIGIEGLKRHPASFWVLIERKNRLFETVEPRRAQAGRSLGDPEVQLFELSFGVLGELNAICHACVEAG